MTTGGVVRWGNRRWIVMVLGLVAGPALAAPEPPGPVPPAPAPPAAETGAGYRLGYRSDERATLVVSAATTGVPAPLLTTDERSDADRDVDARAGRLVWIGHRAGTAGTDLGGALYLRRPGTTPLRLVGGPGTVDHPALSPDGRRVAFTSDRGGNPDIWLVATDGSGLRRLTDHPAGDSWPTWSPDGTRIAFSSTRDDPAGDIHLVPATGGTPVRVTDGPAADGQPAWSPDGRQLAFTTTRFAPAADPTARTVATVAVGGGPVTRAVPGPGNASEPAWSPDGTRIAFTAARDDRSGDVHVIRAGRVTPVATGPLAEHGPAWSPDGDLLWTATERTASTDVWTADATGADRRDHTARPGLSETTPAFSPDGTRLAYSAEQSGTGTRIVVADATGANPQTLAPPGTVAGDRDTDPSWSPAGDAIAFTRYPADPAQPSRVLVVAVADARLLTTVDMPSYLSGRDAEPTWSPDGRQLAFARQASPRQSDLTVPKVDRPAYPGTTFTVEQSVRTPEIPPRPDILFLVDDTASMSQPGEGGESVIGQLKARLPEVIQTVRTSQPDARFGLATFSGRLSEGGDYDPDMYRLRQPVTDDDAAIARAVGALTATSQYGEENWFYALQQIAAGNGVGFRPDGSRIVVLISDTNSRDKTAPDGTPITSSDLRDDLVDAKITLIGVPIVSVAGENGLDSDRVASWLATETGGRLAADSTPAQMIDAISKAIRELTITVHPRATCEDGLSVAFFPDPAKVHAGTPARFTETVSVAPGAVPGSVLRCTLRFDLDPPEAGADTVQELIVRVAYPGGPLVRVDDMRVPPDGPDGTRVRYRAMAVDSDNQPLPVRCEPAPGALFPIGQTVVTCTATDRDGRTGSDTALIVVADPQAAGSRIWLARLDGSIAGTLTVTDQRDLSARVGNGCPGRATDRSPAWAPDGSALAFADSSQPADLCVVAPDGSGARHPLAPTDRAGRSVADPAWSPDSRLVAVTLQRSEEPRDIVVLPAAGGTPVTVIRAVGAEPAFQRLPVPDLSLAVSVGGQPGYIGGDPVPVTFTVRNDTPLPADNVWLEVTAPDPLLPAVSADPRCGTSRRLCLLGTLGPAGQQVVTVVLPARAAVTGTVSGRVTATVRQVPATRTAQAPVRVLAPTVTLDPAIGPPGFVTTAVGTGFPPGSQVRLRWAPGITTTPDTVTVGADGTFRTPMLILRKDTLGLRELTATRVSGATFAPVRATAPFLVVPRGLAPPVFGGRG
ncbi:VWA domain-containing protein [Micromonospora sp. CPCC 206060]|uniref:VWA domain-containing protein n=1 Tax=Micromonospora sp. CPCC 206060 TaxID=3122406 RepID=UPI002FF12CB1